MPELADRCIVVNGVAKTYAMTGWRVGWMLGPADVVKAATNLQSHATSNVAQRQPASRRSPRCSGDLSAVATMREAFDRRRQTIVRMLRDIPGVDLPRAAGRLLRLPLGRRRARQGDPRPCGRRPAPSCASWSSSEAEVAVVPGEAFGTPGYVRMSYALGDDDLVEGVTRLHKLLAEAR